jgi:nucleoside-diphosphate-sugar epimerase
LASEEAAHALQAKGIDAYILRLPPTTHGTGDRGFVQILTDIAKEKGQSAYRDAGDNHWPACHRFDAARLYRLIIEQKPSLKVFHAAAEQGIPLREIAKTIGKCLNLPVVSKSGAEADAHFSWFSYFTTLDCVASSEESRKVTGWKPKEVGLLQDIIENEYFN